MNALEGESNPKHFSFFLFYFNVPNKTSPYPLFINFWRIFYPKAPLPPFIPTPISIKHSRVLT